MASNVGRDSYFARLSFRSLLVCLAASGLLSIAFPDAASAQVTYEVIADFDGSVATQAWGGLIKGSDGALYGTTAFSDTPSLGCGTVYRIAADGTLSILHEFVRSQGCFPVGELVEGPDGNLYGTTSEGGPTTPAKTGGRGIGTVYRVSKSGDFTLLHEFAYDEELGIAPEGAYPFGAMALGANNDLYGTTNFGGIGCGTVFRITFSGDLTVLHSFGETGPSDGCDPNSGLSRGLDGNFYGAALADEGSGHGGSIFRVTSDGDFSVLANLPGQDANGCSQYGTAPLGEPVQDSAGNLYGTAQLGPCNGDLGTVWKLSPDGNLSLLHAFTGPDGAFPMAGLTLGSDGNLYGTTAGNSGVDTFGTMFRITPSGTLATLHVFDQPAGPDGRLLEVSPGVFVGTTVGGGAGGKGFVFRVSVGSATATSLDSSPFPSIFGQQVTLSAAVDSPSGTPDGDVAFFDGDMSLGTVALTNGTASLTVTNLTAGTHSLSAVYESDGTFLPSESSPISHVVNKSQTSTTMSSAPNPSAKRQAVTFAVQVIPVSPGGGTPTGQVRVMKGKKSLGSATLINGTATLSISFAQQGQQTLTAVYTGDSNFGGSSSSSYTHTVLK